MSWKPSLTIALSIFLSLLFAAPSVFARIKRAAQIPSNGWSCAACHTDSEGDSPRNAFGQQVEKHLTGNGSAASDVDWSAIYDLDADGDGYTNGEELGDPYGMWRIGDDQICVQPTHPAKKSDTPCPDNSVKSECDAHQDPDAGGQNPDVGAGPDVGSSDVGVTSDAGEGSDAGVTDAGGTSDTSGKPDDNLVQLPKGECSNGSSDAGGGSGGFVDVGGFGKSDSGSNKAKSGDSKSGCGVVSSNGGYPVGLLGIWVVLLGLGAVIRRFGRS